MKWRAYPLHPEVPEQGLRLEELFSGQPMDVETIMARMATTARSFNLPFKPHDKIYNSRLAQELGAWADSLGKGSAFHSAAFKAYFAEGKNLADHAVLIALSESVGLPPSEAKKVLSERQFQAAVDADWALARERNITAVPTLSCNNQKLVGAQPYETLVQFAIANGADRKSETS